MAQTGKIFRVFISSTFSDMRQERAILQRETFPRLERFCEERGGSFQAVDLRWGVNEQAAYDQKTLRICLNEIDRCQKVSPRPNFLILLGNKYGWQPVPETIPQAEMDIILKHILPEEADLLDKWYKLDTNALPKGIPGVHEYVLQPRARLEPMEGETIPERHAREYDLWSDVEAELRNILRQAVGKAKNEFTNEQREKYFTSATHQEILRGALHPSGDSHPEKHVFACFRQIDGLPEDETAKAFIDLSSGTKDTECEAKITTLKRNLHDKLGDKHIFTYRGKWSSGDMRIDAQELQRFSENVYQSLKNVILDEMLSCKADEETDPEPLRHQAFRNRLTEHFRGRDGILKELQDYLDDNNKRILALVGDSGSGKSSILARLTELTEQKKTPVVYRFIGTTSASSNPVNLLQSLCTQIGIYYSIDPKTFLADPSGSGWNDLSSITVVFRKCLELPTAEKPLLIFLDALDQLNLKEERKPINWLPSALPDNVKIITSCLPEWEVVVPDCHVVKMVELTEEEARDILNQWLASIKRTLTSEQFELVITSFLHTKSPLLLKLAFEKAKHWHGYDQDRTLKQDVAGIIQEFFADLEREHTHGFVKNAICYMLSGRYGGLTENELLEVLAFDDEYWGEFLRTSHPDHVDELTTLKKYLEEEVEGVRGYMKIPISVWSRFYQDMETYLAEKDADGIPVITLFHRMFIETLKVMYGLPLEKPADTAYEG
jgi:plasmid stability protein